MKLKNVLWNYDVNHLVIECLCGKIFTYPINRWKVICPECKKSEPIDNVRNQECQYED